MRHWILSARLWSGHNLVPVDSAVDSGYVKWEERSEGVRPAFGRLYLMGPAEVVRFCRGK